MGKTLVLNLHVHTQIDTGTLLSAHCKAQWTSPPHRQAKQWAIVRFKMSTHFTDACLATACAGLMLSENF